MNEMRINVINSKRSGSSDRKGMRFVISYSSQNKKSYPHSQTQWV